MSLLGSNKCSSSWTRRWGIAALVHLVYTLLLVRATRTIRIILRLIHALLAVETNTRYPGISPPRSRHKTRTEAFSSVGPSHQFAILSCAGRSSRRLRLILYGSGCAAHIAARNFPFKRRGRVLTRHSSQICRGFRNRRHQVPGPREMSTVLKAAAATTSAAGVLLRPSSWVYLHENTILGRIVRIVG